MNLSSHTSRDFPKQVPILRGNCSPTHTSSAALPGHRGIEERVSGSQVPQMKRHHEKLSYLTTLNTAVQEKLPPPRAVQTSGSESTVPQKCSTQSSFAFSRRCLLSSIHLEKQRTALTSPCTFIQRQRSCFLLSSGIFCQFGEEKHFVGTRVSATELEAYPSHSSTIELRKVDW